MLNKNNNDNDLTDEDILHRRDVQRIREINEDEKNNQARGNDFVDSSLFVFDEIKNEDTLETRGDKDKTKFEIGGQNLKTLRRSTDIQKLKVSVPNDVLNKGNNVGMSKDLSFNDDIIVIKADKEKKSGYFKWIVSSLALILVVILGGGAYFFIKNREYVATEVVKAPEISNEINSNEIIESSKENVEQIEISVVDPFKVKIDVFNGSGVAGAAGKIKDVFTINKYENIEAKNYSGNAAKGNIVYYKEESLKETAQQIADILIGKKMSVEIKLGSPVEESNADISIILGK
jgi:hypothetical protein